MSDIPHDSKGGAKSKIVLLPKPENTVQSALDEFRSAMKSTIEFEQLKAQLLGAKFKALIENGFSRAEALQLIKE